MKYIKKFNEEFGDSIFNWCKRLSIYKYEIREDGFVDAEGIISLNYRGFKKIPIKFGIIKGHFHCDNNKLQTLTNCPYEVKGDFDCHDNKLVSLEGCVKKVGNDFICTYNKLTTLVGGPIKVGGTYLCAYNNLISLEGAPTSLGDSIKCYDNPIYEVYILFGSLDRYKASLDYNYLRGTNIVRGRFEKACKDAEIDVPDSIPGYEYINL
jgi:hypothetical protein